MLFQIENLLQILHILVLKNKILNIIVVRAIFLQRIKMISVGANHHLKNLVISINHHQFVKIVGKVKILLLKNKYFHNSNKKIHQ